MGVVVYMANPTCPVCGKPMTRFENPERFFCTRTADHARLAREARQHSGGYPKGKGNPQSKETLHKNRKKKK